MEQVIRQLPQWRQEHQETLAQWLRIPSISSDPGHAEAVRRCAGFTAQLLREAGAEQVTIHPTAGHPVVSGVCRGGPDRPTVLVYGHYDVQPVDPLAEWQRDPFDPHIHNERMVARGSADDKGQVLMHIKALEAIRRVHGGWPVNVLFLIEGEEEVGSPNLPLFLENNQQLLRSDVALVSDSAMWAEGMPAITAALRGLVLLEVCVTGPNRDLHSGSFGGAVANPLEVLARLLAGMKDEQGRVVIPGFYDLVREITPEERRLLGEIPFDEAAYLAELGVRQGWGEAGHGVLERVWFRPTLEINGLWGGFTGVGAKTVLPARAQAKLSMRLVADQDPDRLAVLVGDWLKKNAPPTVDIEVTRLPGGGRAVVAPLEIPAMGAARRALRESFGREPLILREGGSIPIVAEFQRVLGINTLLLGFSLPDARTHSPNENLHLPTFHSGIESLVRLYHYLGEG